MAQAGTLLKQNKLGMASVGAPLKLKESKSTSKRQGKFKSHSAENTKGESFGLQNIFFTFSQEKYKFFPCFSPETSKNQCENPFA